MNGKAHYSIKCYSPSQIPSGKYFYILSKGMNAGRPSNKPNCNCFVFSCSEQSQLDQFYWLLYALWAGKAFHPFLVGSCIPFLRKRELENLIQSASQFPVDFEALADKLKKMQEMEDKLSRQHNLIKMCKVALLRKFISVK